MLGFLSRFVDSNDRELRRIEPLVERINELEPEMQARSDEELRAFVDEIREEIRDYWKRTRVTLPLLELRNIALVSQLVIECATRRLESRGLHYRTDYPKLEEFASDTMLDRGALELENRW